jgi:Amt family ammonium transporter
MVTTWLRSGKPDVGMSLNGVLAGLVAITAGCAYVTPGAAIIIGLISGPLVVFGALALEKFKIDDPVGAVPVHLINGIWGTLAVGLFATIPGNTGTTGLFAGGGTTLLVAQLVGVLAVGGWCIVTTGVLFMAIKATVGLRVSAQEEIEGLDIGEHGASAYPDMVPSTAEGTPASSGTMVPSLT